MLRQIASRLRVVASYKYDALAYDWRFHTDTGGVLWLPEHGAQARRPYEGARWRMLSRLFAGQPFTSDDVFLDVGCGKGRAVLQAARLVPFRRVVGIDFSPQLVDVARRNVERNRRRLRCADVELLVADATSWPVPDDVSVVFLYNPLAADLLAQFLALLLASLERRPRRLRLLYVNAAEHATVMASGRFRDVATLESGSRGPSVRIYEAQEPVLGVG